MDGPTQSTAYTIKQIGANAIADNSITSTKPAKSFMKNVSVRDDVAGHAVGWDPDGATPVFAISDPDIEDFFLTYISGEVEFSGNPPAICGVTGHNGIDDVFTLGCTTAPQNGAELRYLVITLPDNIVQ